MTLKKLKLKITNCFDKTVLKMLYNEKIRITGVFFVD